MARLRATNYADLDRLLGNRQSIKIGNNTTAERHDDEIVVRLHGHQIVSLQPDCLMFSLAGYGTVTTRERVNHFLKPLGRYVAQRDYVQVYNDGEGESPLDPYKWTTVTV